jgi:hypothetical protein
MQKAQNQEMILVPRFSFFPLLLVFLAKVVARIFSRFRRRAAGAC